MRLLTTAATLALFTLLLAPQLHAKCVKGNCYSGYGVRKSINATYDGSWRNSRFHGYGIYSFNKGDVYKGSFRNGRFHGKGTLTKKDGARLSGTWRNGQYNFSNSSSYSSGNKKSTPEVSYYRLATQYMYGLAFGTVLFNTGFGIGETITTARHKSSDYYDFSLPMTVGVITLNFGAAFGSWWIGNSRSIQGSYWYTLLGSVAGTIAGYALSTIIAPGYYSTFIIFSAPIGATVGHYLSREQVGNRSSRALLNINSDTVSFGAPQLFIRQQKTAANSYENIYSLLLCRATF